MTRKALLVGILIVAAAAPLSAGQVTKTLDFAPTNNVQRVDLAVDDVVVNQITFNFGGAVGGGLQRSKSYAEARIDNNGSLNQEVGVAVVLLDAQGSIVATGTGGTRLGSLKKGERDTSRISFLYVYRFIENATKIIVTLEAKPAN